MFLILTIPTDYLITPLLTSFNPLNQVYVFNEYEITREAIEKFLKVLIP